MWSLVTETALSAIPGSVPWAVATVLGVLVALVGASVCGILAGAVLVSTRLARRTAKVFLPAAFVMASATASLLWMLLANFAPALTRGPDAGWVATALGAIVLLGPIAAAVVAGHIPSRRPWWSATAAVFATYLPADLGDTLEANDGNGCDTVTNC